jgi:hypothetical protein
LKVMAMTQRSAGLPDGWIPSDPMIKLKQPQRLRSCHPEVVLQERWRTTDKQGHIILSFILKEISAEQQNSAGDTLSRGGGGRKAAPTNALRSFMYSAANT